ncbi:hypothetical protein ACFWCB_26405 [Streptomyces sp. NPDC060048]|uniref:hypothetical protein n=1 Tax=unclassified Streptomyces TaxID=2593676 RepID=UPI0036AF9470
MALSRTAYVNLLRAQTGYHEGRDPGGNWNNMQKFSPAVPGLEWSQGQAWCHTFVSWGADELGGRDAIPITASCAAGVSWWKKRGRWSEYPVLGAPFYLGTAGQDHVGVVYRYDADNIWTIEGNTNAGGSYQGDGVYQRVRPRRGAGSPYGYGVPDFSEATVSADPRLGGTPSAAVEARPTPTTPPQETNVTPAEIEAVAAAVWNFPLPNINPDGSRDGGTKAAFWWLVWQDVFQAQLLAAIDAAKLTPAQVQQAVVNGTLKVQVSVVPALGQPSG